MFTPKVNHTPQYTASRAKRRWFETATPQFWLLVIVGGVFSALVVIALGQALFRPHYSQVPVYHNQAAALAQPVDTDTPSPEPSLTPTATIPAGYAPWWNRMTATTGGQYLPPPDVQAQMEQDWNNISTLYTLPAWASVDPNPLAAGKALQLALTLDS